jgi:hypothetical protein
MNFFEKVILSEKNPAYITENKNATYNTILISYFDFAKSDVEINLSNSNNDTLVPNVLKSDNEFYSNPMFIIWFLKGSEFNRISFELKNKKIEGELSFNIECLTMERNEQPGFFKTHNLDSFMEWATNDVYIKKTETFKRYTPLIFKT